MAEKPKSLFNQQMRKLEIVYFKVTRLKVKLINIIQPGSQKWKLKKEEIKSPRSVWYYQIFSKRKKKVNKEIVPHLTKKRIWWGNCQNFIEGMTPTNKILNFKNSNSFQILSSHIFPNLLKINDKESTLKPLEVPVLKHQWWRHLQRAKVTSHNKHKIRKAFKDSENNMKQAENWK